MQHKILVLALCLLPFTLPLQITTTSQETMQVTTSTSTSSYAVTARVFFGFLAVIFFYRFLSEGLVNVKHEQWRNVARTFPTLELFKGSHTLTDNPGISSLCRDWGGGDDLQKCWDNMLAKVQDKTWVDPKQYRSLFSMMKIIFESILMLIIVILTFILALEIHAQYKAGLTGASPRLTISGDDLVEAACPPLFNSHKISSLAGVQGSIVNGDEDNVFGIQCSGGHKLSSTCEVACRPNYVVNAHLGSVAICSLLASGTLDWMPASDGYHMCVPDIIMATPNLAFHARFDLNQGSMYWKDFSGNNRPGLPFMTPTNGEHGWEFGSENEFVIVSKLPGESTFLRSQQPLPATPSAMTMLTASIFAVVHPANLEDWQKFTDLIDLRMFFGNTSPPECVPLNQPSVFTFLAWHSTTHQFASLRINGKSCNNLNSDPFQHITSKFHNFNPFGETTGVIGCSYAQQQNRALQCDAGNQFHGTISEFLVYTDTYLNISSCVDVYNLRDYVNVTCPRANVEAIELFLSAKHQINSTFSKGTCPTDAYGNTICSENLPVPTPLPSPSVTPSTVVASSLSVTASPSLSSSSSWSISVTPTRSTSLSASVTPSLVPREQQVER